MNLEIQCDLEQAQEHTIPGRQVPPSVTHKTGNAIQYTDEEIRVISSMESCSSEAQEPVNFEVARDR